MVAEQVELRTATHEELTDAGRAEVRARAVDIVMGLADGHGLRRHPRLRGDLLLMLSTDAGSTFAAHALVERFGFVSREPDTFVRMQLQAEQWPAGF